MYTSIADWENFAVKNNFTVGTNQLRKFNIRKSLMFPPPPPRGKCPINSYSQQYMALLIPDSRLNARNTPDALPYCSRQPLKKFCGWNELRKFNTRNLFTQIIFNVKIFMVFPFYLPLQRCISPPELCSQCQGGRPSQHQYTPPAHGQLLQSLQAEACGQQSPRRGPNTGQWREVWDYEWGDGLANSCPFSLSFHLP